jgi:GAF domain-containing protein
MTRVDCLEGIPVDLASLVELAAVVLDGQDLEAVLDRVARIAQRTLPGAAEVSLTTLHRDSSSSAASTGPLAGDATRAQYTRGQGPSLDAARTGLVLRVDDMRTEPRWPRYAAACPDVRSSLSLPLPVRDRVIGALTGYATAPHAFPDGHLRAARIVAAYAAVTVYNARVLVEASALARQMREAMTSRAVIEQAKGVIMCQRACRPDEAFEVLTGVSQRTNTKLRDVAAGLVARTAVPRR